MHCGYYISTEITSLNRGGTFLLFKFNTVGHSVNIKATVLYSVELNLALRDKGKKVCLSHIKMSGSEIDDVAVHF